IVDDDSWINIGRLKSNCLNKQYHGVTGNLYRAEKPHRKGKWAVSLNDYPQDFYPTFLAGGLCIFEMKYVHKIYKAATNNANLPALFIDDVYITGIIAEQLKIERHSSGWGIISFKCDQHYSRFRLYQLLSILQCNIKQLKQIWDQTMTTDDYYRKQKVFSAIYNYIPIVIIVFICLIILKKIKKEFCSYHYFEIVKADL
ncbi:unnamed protein product, partial [Didymodactylos carnosus]